MQNAVDTLMQLLLRKLWMYLNPETHIQLLVSPFDMAAIHNEVIALTLHCTLPIADPEFAMFWEQGNY